ncbi:arsenate reductase [Limnohabitans sp.]|uniref:arsenate reductase n=1 Tax=Limnohabitans sp. TaxID=1907725 RepID=UPI0039BC74E8|nr:arsenate reductase [Comamonadaceae bacterium]
MHPVVYGIPNCDTVKKARTWLADQGLEARFHDFKKQGVPAAELDTWLAQWGWEILLNRQGSTWRKLDTHLQASVTDNESAKAVMLAHTSCIKRPVIAWPSGHITVGFKPEHWPA